MNIGFSSLQFASKDEVREVHSFEPFRSTYDRAIANIYLNGSMGRKISPHNFGLADRNWSGDVLAAQTWNSGAMSTVDAGQGTPIHVSLRDAAEVLAPIIESARARGLDIIVKMDCEGSEYAICESLMRAGLLRHISAFMVEWHAIFADKSQADLTRPLREAGFIIFDRSPPKGNGFFYAANLGAPRIEI
jgi:FkbM family methyltransferase